VLVAWDRHGTLEYRMWRKGRLTAVKKLASVVAAMHLSVALDNRGHALIAYVDQPVNEGGTNTRAQVEVSRDFGKPQLLERYPDLTIVSGVGVQAAYVDGRPLVVWSGRTAVRASFDGQTSDLAPVAAAGDTNQSLTDLAVHGDDAVVAVGTGSQILAVPLVNGVFGPAEAVSPVGQFLGRPAVGFDGDTAVVAWRDPAAGVEVAQRAF
jgi:hypothetical protein